MDYTKLHPKTRGWVISVRSRLSKIEEQTEPTRSQIVRLIISMKDMLVDKDNRHNILTALIGRYITSSKEISKQEHMVLIDMIDGAGEYIRDMENNIIPMYPGGAMLVVEYTPETRHLLSSRIKYDRGVYVAGKGECVICFDCGDPIESGGDLHEGFITRGQVSMSESKNKIFTKYNCAHRHNVCPDNQHSHTPGTGGNETLLRFTLYMIQHEGYNQIRAWLEKAAIEWEHVGQEALNRFLEMTKNYKADGENG